MPFIPDYKNINDKADNLDPRAVLSAIINDMKDAELERELVEAGYARYVEEEN